MSSRTDPRPARDWPIPPMDHASGYKDTAFTWAMGNLILQRIADGETVKAITADPRMPAYCTVFRWMQVVPAFGEAVAEVRTVLAQRRLLARLDAERARAEETAARANRGERVRWWVSGQKSTYDAWWAEVVLRAVEEGAAISHVLDQPGMPSTKAWYRWLRRVPGLAELYAEACRRRAAGLEMDREMVVEHVAATGIPAANRAIRAIDGRAGRTRPRTYRAEGLAEPYWLDEGGALRAPDWPPPKAGKG